jgi:membrane glycosyltransferase
VISRWLFAGLVAATTAAATSRLWDVLRVDGVTAGECLFLALVTILFCWIAIAFWMMVLGAFAIWRDEKQTALQIPDSSDPQLRSSGSRTALLFPVRNEETARLCAGIEAVIDSLAGHGVLDRFDIFILSDSNEHLEGEQAAYAALAARWQSRGKLYYRHRTSNEGRKSGNIAQFCRSWGNLYDYMVVLDADSLMTAGTLVELVRLMDANPRAGLIQAPPELVGRDSLFARIQQFASSVYGPLNVAGLAMLMGGDGNYWGHNAIIRVRAFVENCGLPVLPGRAPLGGEIMSHDFVEAALLRRAGWDVHLAGHLGGSYEEPPPGLIDFLKRDRRWCQGNLQHMRIIFARGLKGASRGHLAMGVMSYLASPLWFAFLLTSVVVTFSEKPVERFSFVGTHPVLAWPVSHAVEMIALFSAMAVMLFAPKALALLLVLRDRQRRRAHGGAFAVTLSVVIEAVFSALLAPIVMLSETGFVVSILLGKAGGWRSQQRNESGFAWLDTIRTFLPHTLAGAASAAFAWFYLPAIFWWMSPIFAGLVLAIPLTALAGSAALGRGTRALALFVAPWERGEVPIVERVRAAVGENGLRTV